MTASGRDPYQEWVDKLKDRTGRVAILRQVDRVMTGNFGEHKPLQEGVWELKIDVGPRLSGVLRTGEHDGRVVALRWQQAHSKRRHQRAVRYWHDSNGGANHET